MRGKVLIAAPVHDVLTKGLAAEGYELVVVENITQDLAFKFISNCVGVITSTRLQLNKDLLDAAPLLQWIGRMGSGMEVIDVEYAIQKGIQCFSSPEGNCNAVAEHALGLLLGLTKKIVSSNEEVRQGKWLREENRGMELEGKTIGIIGFGHTGTAFAKKLSGFDMHILAYDKYKRDLSFSGIEFCKDLNRIFKEADIISFHVPLQEDTLHYFNDFFLNQMQKPFILLNTSRGQVVDTNVILLGLKGGKLRAVGLDVLEEEPLSKTSIIYQEKIKEIQAYTQVIITPHIAGYSHEALYKMSKTLLTKIVTRM